MRKVGKGHEHALHHHYRSVYDNAEVYGAQREQVGAHAFETEAKKGEQQGKRDNQGNDKGGAPVGHKDQHNKGNQHNTFQHIV